MVRLCPLPLLALVSLPLAAAEPPPAWHGEVAPLVGPANLRCGAAVVPDPAAAGGKAIRIPFQKDAGGWSVVFSPPKMSMQGRCRLTLSVRGEGLPPISDGVAVTFVAHDKQTGQWAASRESRLYGSHLRPGGYVPVTFPDLELPLTPDTYGPEIIIACKPESPGLTPVLLLDRAQIAVEQFTGPIIAAMGVDKVHYFPQETVTCQVTVANPTGEGCEVTVAGDELSGLDTGNQVFSVPATLGAGEQKTVPARYTLGPAEYGRELRVRLLRNGKVVDTASDYFGVSRLPLWVCAGNGYDGSFHTGDRHSMFYVSPAAGQQSRQAVQFWQRRHKTYWEFFSWAPGDIADLSPAEDPFPGGEGRLTYRSRETLRQQTAMIAAAGMWPVSYVNGTAWADAGYKLFQRHPEWFLYDANGEVAVYDMAKREKYRHKDDFDFDPNTYTGVYFQGVLNHSLPEVQDFIARQFIRCGKEMGFKGVRLDVRYLEVYPGERDFAGKEVAPGYAEADRISAAAVKRVKALVHQELPDFTFGYNYASPEETKDMRQTFIERCEGGAWMLDEICCTYQEKTSPYHLWQPYLRRLVSWGDQVRKWGGVYNPYDFRRYGGKYMVDRVYSSIFRLICSGRDYMGWTHNSRLPFGDLGAFATRFSEVLFGAQLEWIADVKGEVAVSATAPLWWQDTCLWNRSSAGRRQLIVHLINPPRSAEVEENPTSQLNPPVRDITVVCASSGGQAPRAAYLLTAEPMELWEQSQVQAIELALKPAGDGKTAVTVPSVLLWKMVVFEF